MAGFPNCHSMGGGGSLISQDSLISIILPYKAKRQYLLTLQLSRYCLLQSSVMVNTITVINWNVQWLRGKVLKSVFSHFIIVSFKVKIFILFLNQHCYVHNYKYMGSFALVFIIHPYSHVYNHQCRKSPFLAIFILFYFII